MIKIYKQQIEKNAASMAAALARGQDIIIKTNKSGILKIKILEVKNLINEEEKKQAGL